MVASFSSYCWGWDTFANTIIVGKLVFAKQILIKIQKNSGHREKNEQHYFFINKFFYRISIIIWSIIGNSFKIYFSSVFTTDYVINVFHNLANFLHFFFFFFFLEILNDFFCSSFHRVRDYLQYLLLRVCCFFSTMLEDY